MTLTELRYIVAVAREQHFGRAAEACHVSQPTLSVAVKKLEKKLGLILFERGQHEISVTPAGAPVVEQAARVLAEAARIRELAESAGDPLVGPLRLGAIYTIGPYVLPSLVRLLHERAPKMPLILEENYTTRLLAALKGNEIDAALLALPVQEPGIVAQPLYDESFRVVLPADHAWRRQRSINPAQLLQEPLLLLGRGNCFRDQVLDLCARVGEGGARIMEGSSLETIRMMVASGVGVTVMPASAVDGIAGDNPLLCVRPFTAPQPQRRVALVWRASYPRHQALDVLRQAIFDCRLSGVQLL